MKALRYGFLLAAAGFACASFAAEYVVAPAGNDVNPGTAAAPFRTIQKAASVMKAGEVTTALHNLSVGDKVGVRGPMGNGFPVEDWKGKKILYALGGIGSAALKATIEYTLEHRADYAGISILYGATHPTNFT